MQGSIESKNQFTFEIAEHICVLGKGREDGYTKELNYVSFRGLPPKWDVREWNSDHTRMTKGITFTGQEMKTLLEAMNGRAILPADCGGNFCGKPDGKTQAKKDTATA